MNAQEVTELNSRSVPGSSSSLGTSPRSLRAQDGDDNNLFISVWGIFSPAGSGGVNATVSSINLLLASIGNISH